LIQNINKKLLFTISAFARKWPWPTFDSLCTY